MSDTKNIEAGYYWVIVDDNLGEEEIARCDAHERWQLIGSDAHFSTKQFLKIGPKLFPPPPTESWASVAGAVHPSADFVKPYTGNQILEITSKSKPYPEFRAPSYYIQILETLANDTILAYKELINPNVVELNITKLWVTVPSQDGQRQYTIPVTVKIPFYMYEDIKRRPQYVRVFRPAPALTSPEDFSEFIPEDMCLLPDGSHNPLRNVVTLSTEGHVSTLTGYMQVCVKLYDVDYKAIPHVKVVSFDMTVVKKMP
jgi:hypothetical protein